MIAGVCAGFAQRYGWDVVVVRLVLLLTTIFAGMPLIAYLVAWMVMPNEQYALPAQVAGARMPGPGMPQAGVQQPGADPGSIVV